MNDLARLHTEAEAAWTTLFHACYPRTVAAAEKICPAWCDPEDLASEAMTRLVEADPLPRFKSFRELLAWLEAEVHRIASSG